MPDRPGVDDNDSLKRLIGLWRDGEADLASRQNQIWRSIGAELRRGAARDEIRIDRLKLAAGRLEELAGVASAIGDDLADETKKWIDRNGIVEIYGAGVLRVSEFAYTIPHRAAVEVLADDLFDDVLKLTAHIDDGAKAWVRRVGRELTGFKLTGGQAVKAQARQFEGRLRHEFVGRGITAVTYRDGSRHGFGEYAEMLLRTKTAVAYNVGTLNQMRGLGIQFVEILDGSLCGLTAHEDTQLANGMIVPVEIAAAFPIAHPNAVIGGQWLRPVGAARQVVRAQYRGPAVGIRVAEESWLAVTPDHPVLTRRGWVSACEVKPGDYVLGYGEVIKGALWAAPNLNESGYPQDLFPTAVKVGSYSRVVASADDLHGAGRFCDPEIDVVDVQGILGDHLESLGLEGSRDRSFPFGRLSEILDGLGAPTLRLDRVPLAPAGGVSGADHGGPIVGAGLAPSSGHRFGPCWHRVSSVDQFDYSGAVYDASTDGECYTVNGFVVANCRRSLNPRPDVTPENLSAAASVQSDASRADQAAWEAYLRAQQRASSGPRGALTGSSRPAAGLTGRTATGPVGGQRAGLTGSRAVDPRVAAQRAEERAGLARRREYVERTRAQAKAAREMEALERSREAARRAGFRGQVDPDVLRKWGVSEQQWLNGRAVVQQIRSDIRAAAKQEADELGDWLFNNDLATLTRPERLVRRTDLVSGQSRFARTQSGYDWLEQLDDAETARIRARMVDSDLFTPDVLSGVVRQKTNLDLSDDEAMNWLIDRWLQEDGLRSVASGRLPKYANPENLLPADQALEGYRLDQLFGVDLDDAAGHVATVQAENAAREAAHLLGSPKAGPAPWEMEFSDYLRDLEQVEDILGRTQIAPGIDPGEAFAYARERIVELVPPELDPGGTLHPVELFERIRLTAQAAGLTG